MRRIIPGLVLLLCTTVASAASSLQFGPPPHWVRPTPLPSPGKPTSAAVKYMLLDHQIEFSGRTVSYYVESAAQIQTPQGLSTMGTFKLIWNPDTDVVVVHKVHILRGNKVIDVLGAGQTFTIARREVNLDYASIDDTLTAILEPADLEVGDILDIAYTLRRTDPVLAGTGEAAVEIPPAVPIQEAHVRALWPAAHPVKWQLTQGISGARPVHAGDMAGIDLTMTDLQPVVQPKGAPFRFLIDRRADFSGFASWSAVAARLAPLYTEAARLSPTSPLRAEIARIRAASTDPRIQAAQALALVENQVRYVFIGMNEGGLVPATADQTWSRRYGDCKAKTVLLLALLHGLGIEARPVAVSVFRGDGLDTRLPMIEDFDHVLVQSVIDGRTYWLDGTRMGDTRLDHLHEPFYHWGLPLVASGAELIAMVPPPLTQPKIDEAIEIDARGGVAAPAPIHAWSEIHGAAGVLLKTRLDNMTPTQLDTALRSIWKSEGSNVKILSVAARYDAQAGAERLTMDGKVTLDFSSGEHDLTLLHLGSKADLTRPPGPNHDAPFAVPYPVFNRITEVIDLPAGGKDFSIVGADVKRTIAGIEYRRHAAIAAGVFTATASARSLQPQFPASEAAADQQAMRELTDSTVGLKAPAGHIPSRAEIKWGLPATNSSADDYAQSGYRLARHGQYAAALADYEAALALDSHDALALANRGITYFWHGQTALARADFDAALAADPHSWVAQNGRGLLALLAGDETAAIAAFTAAIGDNPKDGGFALPLRALAYWRAGRDDRALADYGAAIRLAPDRTDLYWTRAVLLRQAGRKAEALAEAKRVTKANPVAPLAYLTAGAIYRLCGEHAQAAAADARAVAVAPVANTYLMRAAYRSWADRAGMRADLEKALRLDPKSVVARSMLAQVQLASGQYRTAAASLTDAMAKYPDNVDMLTLRGIAWEKAGEAAQAAADFAHARAQAKLPAALNAMCWRLATSGVELSSALADCDAAIAAAPDSAAILDSRGFVLLKLKRYAQAIAAYDSALKLDPLQFDSLYGRGVCELREGEKHRGRADLAAAAMLSPQVAATFAHYGVRP